MKDAECPLPKSSEIDSACVWFVAQEAGEMVYRIRFICGIAGKQCNIKGRDDDSNWDFGTISALTYY